ncbi:hypothetical protein ABZY31_27600 [Streptomyces sp. NPDC006529]|uniref:hypothetical protein n=1 Tax=Streptomyces sp. NPDC006529 TaxID=3157177 RepID=UPI0033B85A77
MQDENSGLREGEFLIEGGKEKLWRQVTPTWVHDGRVTSQIFKPTPKDIGELSVTRQSKVTPKEAYDYYTRILNLNSVGVYSVDVDEVRGEGLRAVDDSMVEDGETRPPGHSFIDFKHLTSKGSRERRGANLRDKAEKRGWQYRPGVADEQ